MVTSFRLGIATLQTGWDCGRFYSASGTMEGEASHCDHRADPLHRSSSALRAVKQEGDAKAFPLRDSSHPRLSRERLVHRESGPTALLRIEETVRSVAVSTYHHSHRGSGHKDEAMRIDHDDGSKARVAIGNDPDRPAVAATDLGMLAVAGFVLDLLEASADCLVAAVSSSEVVWWQRCLWLVSLLAWLAMKLRMEWLRLWRPFCEFRVGCFDHSAAGRWPGPPCLSPSLSLFLFSCSFLGLDLGLEHRSGYLKPW